MKISELIELLEDTCDDDDKLYLEVDEQSIASIADVDTRLIMKIQTSDILTVVIKT